MSNKLTSDWLLTSAIHPVHDQIPIGRQIFFALLQYFISWLMLWRKNVIVIWPHMTSCSVHGRVWPTSGVDTGLMFLKMENGVIWLVDIFNPILKSSLLTSCLWWQRSASVRSLLPQRPTWVSIPTTFCPHPSLPLPPPARLTSTSAVMKTPAVWSP